MDSYISTTKDGSITGFVGPDAVHLVRVRTIISGIRLNIQTNGRMQLTCGATITALLKMAGQYTGKAYKRTQKEQALRDLEEWSANMSLALPRVAVK